MFTLTVYTFDLYETADEKLYAQQLWVLSITLSVMYCVETFRWMISKNSAELFTHVAAFYYFRGSWRILKDEQTD